ncbi:WD40-repeat-containing domain protein [Fusarium tricinctum]|uniref:WD40-repeat-containing domain protein n=1 Tax=Fusarium tricinctum TaxID=61284 RepID=A0A8K0SEK9_9HYPO|nr:WD40-repeat-containing domain protein [Fusarium tricinctum]
MLQRPPRRPQSFRRKCSVDLRTPSPLDSGYFSTDDTCGCPQNHRKRCFPSFDGSSLDEFPASKFLENELQISTPIVKREEDSLGLPKTPETRRLRERAEVVSPFIYSRSSGRLPLKDKRVDTNRRKLDRYVPRRDHISPSSERYRTTKQSQDLSREERLKRDKSASADPFVLKRRVLDPDPRFPFRVDDSNLERGMALGQLPQNRGGDRQVSLGAMWSVGGVAPSTIAVDDGQGHLVRRGTNARVFPTPFQESLVSTSVEKKKHEGRIASALEIDQIRRVLDFVQGQRIPQSPRHHTLHTNFSQTSWNGYQWVNKEEWSIPLRPAKRRLLPAAPFRSLTSVAFSSTQGGKAVLGIGHSDGIVLFQSLFDTLPRFEVRQTFPISCVSWRPICTLRPSKDPLNPGVEVQTEDLVVGDEMGNIYYYVVEWPLGWEVARDTWPGAVSLIAKISNIHFQQVCGLAWSNDGRMFASGGNDNLCCLFDADQVVGRRPDLPRTGNGYIARIEAGSAYGGIEISVTKLLSLAASDDGPVRSFTAQLRPLPTATDTVRYLGPGVERHRWNHGAAVKAIAFCPWRRELVATGGGSNDKCIHFFHTPSGAALATISVSAQVTSLIWNTTRREIAATFGYASPEHPYREDDLRALYAIPFPRGPIVNGRRVSRGGQEGCIIVASSDKTIKFHEVWSRERGVTVGATGILAGSDILEGLEGIDKEGDVIR